MSKVYTVSEALGDLLDAQSKLMEAKNHVKHTKFKAAKAAIEFCPEIVASSLTMGNLRAIDRRLNPKDYRNKN